MEEISYAKNLLTIIGEWERIESLVQRSISGRVRLFDTEGNILVGEDRLPQFCKIVRGSEMGVSRCCNSYTRVCSQENNDAKGMFFHCHAGLSNFAFPIIYEKKILGILVGGAVFSDESHMSKANDLLRELHLDGNENQSTVKDLARIPEEQLKGVMRVMQDIVSPFIANLLQHEHLAQVEQRLRSQVHIKSDELIMDEITGVFSPNYLTTRLDKEISRARRYNENLSLLVLDIENLPEINKNYGHRMGDVVLQDIANILQRYARESEVVARLSGTGFGVIFPRTSQESAEKPLQRLKEVIYNHSYKFDNTILSVPPLVKVGVVEYAPRMQEGEDMLSSARASLGLE